MVQIRRIRIHALFGDLLMINKRLLATALMLGMTLGTMDAVQSATPGQSSGFLPTWAKVVASAAIPIVSAGCLLWKYYQASLPTPIELKPTTKAPPKGSVPTSIDEWEKVYQAQQPDKKLHGELEEIINDKTTTDYVFLQKALQKIAPRMQEYELCEAPLGQKSYIYPCGCCRAGRYHLAAQPGERFEAACDRTWWPTVIKPRISFGSCEDRHAATLWLCHEMSHVAGLHRFFQKNGEPNIQHEHEADSIALRILCHHRFFEAAVRFFAVEACVFNTKSGTHPVEMDRLERVLYAWVAYQVAYENKDKAAARANIGKYAQEQFNVNCPKKLQQGMFAKMLKDWLNFE